MTASAKHPDEAMPVAVRARTILTGCHHATLAVPAEYVPGDTESAATRILVGMIEWAGAPHLIAHPGHRLPVGPTQLTCAGVAEQLGVLFLDGRCEPTQPVTRTPALADALYAQHEHLCEENADGWDLARLLVSRVCVEQVQVLLPVGADRGAGTIPVPIEAYQNASPDPWALHRHDVIAHLESRHQTGLRALVAAHGRVRGASAVTVSALSADGMVLTCLSRDGVTDLVIPFDPPLPHPAELGGWFSQHVPRSR
jgi:hypothetical protein